VHAVKRRGKHSELHYHGKESDAIIEITERDFDKEVLECELPVFAFFTTEWCASCYPMHLFADQLVKEYDGSIKFIRLDKEESSEITEIYHVIAVPTILIFKDSQVVKRFLGFQELRSLRSFLNDMIKKVDIKNGAGNWR